MRFAKGDRIVVYGCFKEEGTGTGGGRIAEGAFGYINNGLYCEVLHTADRLVFFRATERDGRVFCANEKQCRKIVKKETPEEIEGIAPSEHPNCKSAVPKVDDLVDALKYLNHNPLQHPYYGKSLAYVEAAFQTPYNANDARHRHGQIVAETMRKIRLATGANSEDVVLETIENLVAKVKDYAEVKRKALRLRSFARACVANGQRALDSVGETER